MASLDAGLCNRGELERKRDGEAATPWGYRCFEGDIGIGCGLRSGCFMSLMAASVCGSRPPCWASIVPALCSPSGFLLPSPKSLLFPVLGSMFPLVPTSSSFSAAPFCCASGEDSDEPGNTEDFVVGSEICGSCKGGMLWLVLSHRRR